jgi:hypothetical protein
MALTDLNSTNPAFDPARFTKTFRDGVHSEALARLSALHHQAGRDLHLAQFLASAPRFCIVLLLAGAVTLIWASPDGNGLDADFIWATSILLGIAAMTRGTIRGFARHPSRVPLEDAASELRILLLYMGVAWGSGAFLVMPVLPLSAFVFAVGPSLACALIFKDERGVIAFSAPVTFLTAGAALAANIWMAGMILVAGVVIVSLSMLHCAIRRRRDSLPSLALR